MKTLRVSVFDGSSSIRALLRRTIDSADGLTCTKSARVTLLLEEGVGFDAVDAMVIGLARGEEESWPALMADIARSRIPVVILSPPGQSDLRSRAWPERCLILEKPRHPRGWESFRSTLISALRRVGSQKSERPGQGLTFRRRLKSGLDLIAVGCSAGGPDATGEMLKSIGKALEKTTVVIVQHIGAGFESGYIEWLSRILPWVNVEIGEDGEELVPGRIRVAGPGAHLEITEGPFLRLDREGAPEHGHRPSVDRLFQSLARSKPLGSAGVLLSGMGIDGVEGLLSLSRAGCLTMVQDRESSAVFGMPRVALERGAAATAQPPTALGEVLKSYIEAGGGP